MISFAPICLQKQTRLPTLDVQWASSLRLREITALATNLAVEADKVEITGEDNLSVYPDEDTMSGNVVRRYFCKTCGR